MLIDSFSAEWRSQITAWHEAAPDGARLVLLIDGAFVPGLFRMLSGSARPALLFESLPGCSEDARDVSPFIVQFDPHDRPLARLLDRCNGWPMVSAITTGESVEDLRRRLAAWCVVEADGQRFNFRFPDTRRLPAIFEAMTEQQRREFAGTALSWHYMARDGVWHGLSLDPPVDVPSITGMAELNNVQFGQLIEDSEPDEIWVRLQDRGVQSTLLPSQRHTLLSTALSLADCDKLEQIQKVRWCGYCLRGPGMSDPNALQASLTKWIQENVIKDDEALRRTA